MFLGTFTLGWMPTMIKASDRIMNLISVFGAGMLVGAALIVVVPEAIKVIIEATYDPVLSPDEIVPEKTAFNIGIAMCAGYLPRSKKLDSFREGAHTVEQAHGVNLWSKSVEHISGTNQWSKSAGANMWSKSV